MRKRAGAVEALPPPLWHRRRRPRGRCRSSM